MTTLWTITPDPAWQGATAAVLGCGPSLTPEVAEALRQHRTIAVNYAHRLAPWADILLALDGHWPAEWRAFAGQRITGIADPDLYALYIGPRWETVTLAPGHVIEIRNSGLTAIRLAAALGARRILLAGFEPEVNRRFYDDEVDTGARPLEDDPYHGVPQGLAQITAQLATQGVTVEHYTPSPKPPKAVKVIPRG